MMARRPTWCLLQRPQKPALEVFLDSYQYNRLAIARKAALSINRVLLGLLGGDQQTGAVVAQDKVLAVFFCTTRFRPSLTNPMCRR